ncbi:MAG: M14 family zinc carboxypeptidase [Pirellulaceae bacterium]
MMKRSTNPISWRPKLAFCLMLAAAHVPAVCLAAGAVSIDASFPGGNIEVTSNEGEVVHVNPDLRGDSAWFYWCFEATAVEPGRVTFTFPEKVAGFTNGAIGFQGPAISTDRGKSWSWMGTENVEGSSFHFDLSEVGQKVRLAVTIPYLQADFDRFLARNADNPHLKKSVLTSSRGGREVELLQIGAPSPERRAMLVTGRHHAAETMASYVLEGFLQEAMSDGPAGKAFRRQYVLHAVPFVDKDGVEQGDQGKNRKPHDHNRDYGPDSIYPEIQAIKQLDKQHDFKFSLDFHCPTLVMRDHQVMYFVGAKDHPRHNFENVSELASWIKKGLPSTAPSGPLNWLKPAEKPVPMNSHYFGFKEGAVLAATLEFPFAPPGKSTAPDSCREYGRVVLRAWVNAHFAADFEPPTESKPAAVTKPAWLPMLEATPPVSAQTAAERRIREIAITPTPKSTADAAKFKKEYVLELERFGISNQGENPLETSRGINRALQHAKSLGANRIVFPPGTYRISETDPVVLDHRDTIIDLNGATLQINKNGLQKYAIVEIVDGAENLRLTGGTIRGDKDVHDYATEQGVHAWGHGLIVHAGKNLEIDHITVVNATGDGVNSRFTGARTREELLANILHSVYVRHLESGAFSDDGRKIESVEKTRSIEPFDLAKSGGQFEFGYSTGYLGYPFIQSRRYQAYFYDDR